mmetsp:Transcript_13146/g.28538  ORF Transcript_13146/g.28538 Transcript_13146/m.28538 type:complete len:104 (+) Transcript_13146:124-435(+)
MAIDDIMASPTSAASTIAIVTGANQGLGRGLVRCLLQRLTMTTTADSKNVVYLGARSRPRGEQAMAELQQELQNQPSIPTTGTGTTTAPPELKFLPIDVASDE